jgi:Multicopper oxidase
MLIYNCFFKSCDECLRDTPLRVRGVVGRGFLTLNFKLPGLKIEVLENHKLLIVASDSYNLQPVFVDSLVSTSGERYDFVINANQSSGEILFMNSRVLLIFEPIILNQVPFGLESEH